MTVTMMSPSKFDICLLSGVLFNVACVTANYWPPPSAQPFPPSSSSLPLPSSQVYSDILRTLGPSSSSSSSSPYYPPNYSYTNTRVIQDPYYQRADPYSSGSRYPLSTSSGYGYSYGLPSAAASASGYGSSSPPGYGYTGGYGSSSSLSRPYGSSMSSGYYRPPIPVSPYNPSAAASSAIPYNYWRTPIAQSASPAMTPYDAFDRRGGVYGVPGSGAVSGMMMSMPGSGGGAPPPGPMPYGIMNPIGPYSSGSGSSMDYYAPRTAYTKLKSKEKIEGEVRFVQQDNRYVGITGRISGLVPGAHGLHVHESIDKEGGCENIGQHFNPHSSDHGGKSEWIRHVGDLGNIFADSEGIAFFSITDTLISLTPGPHNVLNRTLVVTEFGDDLGKGVDQSKINGNAGKPIACGIISLTSYA